MKSEIVWIEKDLVKIYEKFVVDVIYETKKKLRLIVLYNELLICFWFNLLKMILNSNNE